MKTLLRLVCVLMFSLPMTVFAQVDEELLTEVQNAFANIFKNESVRFSGVVNVDQVIKSGGYVQTQVVNQALEGMIQYANSQFVGLDGFIIQTIEIDQAGAKTRGAVTLDMIFVDETLYMQASSSSGALRGVYPQGWVNINTDASQMPGMDLLSVDQLLSSFKKPLLYPINQETVIGISTIEIPEEVEVPEGTRAYQLTIDGEKAVQSEDVMSLFEGFSQLGIDMNELMQQLMVGATFELVVYIHDGVVVRIESVLIFDTTLTIAFQSIKLEQVAASILNYSDFNIPVEIIAPEN